MATKPSRRDANSYYPQRDGQIPELDEPAYVARQDAEELRANLAAARRYRDM